MAVFWKDRDDVAICQLQQYLLSVELDASFHTELHASSNETYCKIRQLIGAQCREVFSSPPTKISCLQRDVASALGRLGIQYEEEAIDQRTVCSMDILVRVVKCLVSIEVDGPSHFLLRTARERTGSTILKRRHIEQRGYRAVNVPYWDWNALLSHSEKEGYIRRVLHTHVA